MNLSRNEANRASIEFIDGVSPDFRTSIEHALSSVGATAHVVVADGHAGFDEKRAHDALSAGHSFVILHAKPGQLGTVFPGTGITVPENAALFAVQRREIPGHKDRYHTTVTVVPHGDSITLMGSSGGSTEREIGSTPSVPIERIVHAIAQHVAEPTQLDSDLIPPTGACYGIVTYNFNKGPTAISDKIAQQYSVRNTHNYYIYYANGDGHAPYYVILLDLNGNCTPAVGGTMTLDDRKGSGLVTNTVSSTVLDGSLSLTALSPNSTTSSPVGTSISYPITVMAQGNGGLQSTPFTIQRDVGTPNDKWGVAQTGVQANNEAAWTYYENGLWNAFTQTPSNFDSWKWQVFVSDGGRYYKVRDLDTQFNSGVSLETMAVWTIPQNPGNQSPLNCQLHYKHEFLVEFFDSVDWVTPSLWANTVTNEWDVPAWDLVKVTGSDKS